MQEKLLVTGSTGFIGTRLLRRLEREGAVVRVFLRPESDGASSLDRFEVTRGRFDDPDALRRAVAGVDRIVHLAGITKARDEEEFDRGNVMPVHNLLDTLRAYNPGLKRFVYVSSLAAAGPATDGTEGVREYDEPHPVSAYGRSKLRAEQLCMEASVSLPVTIVRPPAVYGPGDLDVLQVFRMLSSGLLVLPGNPVKQRFSMIYVDDLVEGILAAARSDRAAGRTYYLTSAQAWSWDDLIAAARPALGFASLLRIALPKALVYALGAAGGFIGKLGGKPPLINRDKALELVQDYWVCSPERAVLELGFSASTPLAEGIAKTVAWYRQEGLL